MEKWHREKARHSVKRLRVSAGSSCELVDVAAVLAQGSVEQPQHVDISVERRFERRHFRRSGVRRNSDQALEETANRIPVDGDRGACEDRNRRPLGMRVGRNSRLPFGGGCLTQDFLDDGEPRLPFWALPSKTVQSGGRCHHQRLSCWACRAEARGGCCSPGIRSGTFQNGSEPPCRLTVSRRLPTSAPGPSPRVRVVSGLTATQPETRATPVSSMESTILFISHRLCRENDDDTKEESAEQYQKGRGRQPQLVRPPCAPGKDERRNHSQDD